MEPVTGELVACKNGYHLLTWEQVLSPTMQQIGEQLYEIEVAGEVLIGAEKCVCRRARTRSVIERWNAQTFRLLACDGAERTLGHFESALKDAFPILRSSLQVARCFANGEATCDELNAAQDQAFD